MATAPKPTLNLYQCDRYENLFTVARDEAEAINNFCEKEPILLAIGCTAIQFPDVDGCKITVVPATGYECGDDRRKRESVVDVLE